VVGITPQRLMLLNKVARLPTSMSTPLGKAGDNQADTLEDTIEVGRRVWYHSWNFGTSQNAVLTTIDNQTDTLEDTIEVRRRLRVWHTPSWLTWLSYTVGRLMLTQLTGTLWLLRTQAVTNECQGEA